MAITPTVMIAASGMANGNGIGVNPDMTAQITGASTNSITYLITALQANVANVAGLGDTLNSLPTAFTTVANTAIAASSQAASMAPDVKTFISLHSASAAFGSASAEYGAALQQFGSKSFGDLGIGVGSFTDANSGGLTSLIPGLGALAAKAKSSAFGSIGANLDPTALLKGQASIAGASLKDGMTQVAAGLKNYGSLLDFSNPQSLNYQGMYTSLQKQGLTTNNGIDDAVRAAGFDPKVASIIPDNVLKGIFSSITGSDLGKIISQTGIKPATEPQSLLDLLDPTVVMPPGAAAALGIAPGAGIDGLKSVGNTMTNIGVPLDNMSASNLLGSVQTKVGPYLSQLTSLVPQSVKSALGPILGSGASPFGTPSMTDMLGSLSGKHTADFAAANNQINSIVTSGAGQSLVVAMQNLQNAIVQNNGISTALTALQSAVTAFNAQVAGNPNLASALSSINNSMSKVTSHIALENSNLSLAGVNLGSPPTSPLGTSQILAFASKLHSFGVDKLQLGHNDIFSGAATNDLTGDAIKAALAEGKNVAQMAAVGKTPPTVSNTTQALAAANNNNVDGLIQDAQAKFSALQDAKQQQSQAENAATSLPVEVQNNRNDPQFQAALAQVKSAIDTVNSAYDAFNMARNKLIDIVPTVSQAAGQKIQTALSGFQSA
jgi:hypothetical protein